MESLELTQLRQEERLLMAKFRLLPINKKINLYIIICYKLLLKALRVLEEGDARLDDRAMSVDS